MTTGTNTDNRDCQFGSYTFGKSSGNLFENNGEATSFFKQMSVTNQFVRLSIVLGTHSIGSVFID